MAHPTFTAVQLWWLAELVSGGRGDTRLAAAVAGAESSGNPANFLVNTDQWRSVDRGLWQINNHWHAEVSDDCAFRALCNARNAYRISNGWTDFTPWSTFKNGEYLQHFPAASALPVPIPDNELSVRWTPDRGDGTGYTLTPGAAPFGPTVQPPAIDGGPDASPKIHRTGQRAGEHGSALNDAVNAVHKLPAGRTHYG